MTKEEIESALQNHAAWIIHMRDTLDEAAILVQKIAIAGEEADKRIAELGVALKDLAKAQRQTAEAQERTENLLQAFLKSRLTNGHEGVT